MNILVCYDVNTEDKAGRRRLRLVAKACVAYGQRVQFSVFECTLTETELEKFRLRLLKVMDHQQDSLRFYRLAGERSRTVEAYGRDHYVDFTAPMLV